MQKFSENTNFFEIIFFFLKNTNCFWKSKRAAKNQIFRDVHARQTFYMIVICQITKENPHNTQSDRVACDWFETTWLSWYQIGTKTFFSRLSKFWASGIKYLMDKFPGEVHWRGFEQRGFWQRGRWGRGARSIVAIGMKFQISSTVILKYHHKIPWNVIKKYQEVSPWNITFIGTVIIAITQRQHRWGGRGEERLRGGDRRHIQGDRLAEKSRRILGNFDIISSFWICRIVLDFLKENPW